MWGMKLFVAWISHLELRLLILTAPAELEEKTIRKESWKNILLQILLDAKQNKKPSYVHYEYFIAQNCRPNDKLYRERLNRGVRDIMSFDALRALQSAAAVTMVLQSEWSLLNMSLAHLITRMWRLRLTRYLAQAVFKRVSIAWYFLS